VSGEAQAWDTFAAAWLGRVALERKHGEDEAGFATRACDAAAFAADRMIQHRALRVRASGAYDIYEAPSPTQTGISPATMQAVQDVLRHAGITPAGLSPNAPQPSAGVPHPVLPGAVVHVPPMQQNVMPGAPAAHSGMRCHRKFEDGSPCPGVYDDQGGCRVCRLPFVAPGDLPSNPVHPPGARP
jgi:hypothetical protein